MGAVDVVTLDINSKTLLEWSMYRMSQQEQESIY